MSPAQSPDHIGEAAKRNKTFVLAQARIKLPEFPKYYFNSAFLISPRGKVVYRCFKHAFYPAEPSTVPHDVLNDWIKIYVKDSLFPVAKTEIGNIGGIICFERDFPESARGYAFVTRKSWSRRFLIAVNTITIIWSVLAESLAEIYAYLPRGINDVLIRTIIAVIVSGVIIYMMRTLRLLVVQDVQKPNFQST
jgi:predicted amidohydrolase